MNKTSAAGIAILALISLAALSVWSSGKADDILGPTRLVQGPGDTVYILVDDRIVKVSKEGEILQAYTLADLNISEPVADFLVEPNGDLLIGLQLSQEIKIYSHDGRDRGAFPRTPSPLSSEGARDFRFSKDPGSGNLYVSDTFHHRVQTYHPDGSPGPVHTDLLGQSLKYPNGVTVDSGFVYIADRDGRRIVVLKTDGTPDRMISTSSRKRGHYSNPLRVSIAGNDLFVTTRAPIPLPGREVQIRSLDEREEKFLQADWDMGPEDILAYGGGLLVADLSSMSVRRFSETGVALGNFGGSSLTQLLSSVNRKQSMYQWMYFASLGGMILFLICVLIVYQKKLLEPKTRIPETGRGPEEGRLNRLLGPVGSGRHRGLMILVPGLGQAAAGRGLRAFFVVLVWMLLLACLFFSNWLVNVLEISFVMPLLYTSMISLLLAFGVGTALDAIRLNEPRIAERSAVIALIQVIGLPLITLAAGAAAQILWEKIVVFHPEVTIFIQGGIRRALRYLESGGSNRMVFPVVFSVNGMLGWGGVGAALFSILGWPMRTGLAKVLLTGASGFLAGVLSWSVNSASIQSLPGWSFYIYPVQGGLMGLLTYLFFRKHGISVLIIPAAVSGAWAGNFVALYSSTSLPGILNFFVLGTGEIVRMFSVALPAYFIHLSIQIVVNSLDGYKADDSVKQG